MLKVNQQNGQVVLHPMMHQRKSANAVLKVKKTSSVNAKSVPTNIDTPKNHTNIQDTSHSGAIPNEELDDNSFANCNGTDENVPDTETVCNNMLMELLHLRVVRHKVIMLTIHSMQLDVHMKLHLQVKVKTLLHIHITLS